MELINFETIETGLLPSEITEKKLIELKQSCLLLVVASESDTKGYEECKEMRGRVRTLRIDIENRRKERKAGALEFGRRLDSEARRLTSLFEDGERHLIEQIKIVDDAEKRKQEAAAKIANDRFEERSRLLQSYRAAFSFGELQVATEESFQAMLLKAKNEFELLEAERKANQVKLDELEQERVAQALKIRQQEKEATALREQLIAKQQAEIAAQEKERILAEQKLLAERAENDRRERERLDAERAEAARVESERIAAEDKKREEEKKARKLVADKALFEKIMRDFPTVEVAWVEIARLTKLTQGNNL